jgi:hypothetical protein
MGQIARPIADVSTGGWTPTPVYLRINEAVPDTNAVTSPDAPGFAAFEVKLNGIALPKARGDGTHRVKARLKKDGLDLAYAQVMLLAGQRLIAAKEFQPGDTYEDFILELKAAEVARITDYTDLRIRVGAGRVEVPCCPSPLPGVLRVTVTDKTGACRCLPDSFAVAWDEGAQDWRLGSGFSCDGFGGFTVDCGGSSWTLTVIDPSDNNQNDPDFLCGPLLVVWSNRRILPSYCGGSGTATFTITE